MSKTGTILVGLVLVVALGRPDLAEARAVATIGIEDPSEELEYRDGAFLWRPSRISISVETGPTGPRLRFEQALPTGETGWRMKRIALPEGWELSGLRFEGLAVCFENQLGETYRLVPQKLQKLSRKLLEAGPNPPDAEVEKLWRRYAGTE